MKEFVFVVPLTPQKFLSSIRKDLFDLFLKSMRAQTSDNWTALMLGEEEYVEDNFVYLNTGDATIKRDKLWWVMDYFAKSKEKPRYVIRMDDDDLINKDALAELSGKTFDIYRDRYYANYDIATAKIRMSRIDWFPNTCIINYEHIAAPSPEDPAVPLLVSDHSKWHTYFEGKNVVDAPKNRPLYVRIFSPSCKTIYELFHETDQPDPTELNMEQYEKYRGEGNWRDRYLSDYEEYIPELIQIWEDFYQVKIDRKLTLADRINPFPL